MDDDVLPAAEGDGRRIDEAFGALQAWLLAEDAYVRGGVSDEILRYRQDELDRLTGPRATLVAGDFARQYVGGGGDLVGLAGDRSALLDLLALIEGKRRRGFESQWRPAPRAGETRRGETLLVMAEYGVVDPVWARPRGGGGPVSLSALDVSDQLVQRLRAWNETYERSALIDDGWVRQGLALARELQQELPDVEVRYFHADDDRPLSNLCREA